MDRELELGGSREADGWRAQTEVLERWVVGCGLSETPNQEARPLPHI